MTTQVKEKKERKKPVPRNNEAIVQGALNLPLEDKVKLCKLLKEDIAGIAKAAQEAANTAKELVNGL